MSGCRFLYFPRLILIFNVKNSWVSVQARVFSTRNSFSRKNSGYPFKLEFFRRKTHSDDKTQGIRSSSSFFVQIVPKCPGRPDAKSGQNLIRSSLLEAILEASLPESRPASQAQPLGRVFSTKRARGKDRRVFSCSRARSSSFRLLASSRRL